MNRAVSPAALVMLAWPGRIRLVALYVRTRAPVNLTKRNFPAPRVPSAVMVTDPVIFTALPVAVLRSVVDADAMSAPCDDSGSRPGVVPLFVSAATI